MSLSKALSNVDIFTLDPAVVVPSFAIPEFQSGPMPRRAERQREATEGPLAVRTRELSKSFGDNPVLDRIDLDIAAGEFVAVVGKSGCGKSTLLRLLVGLEEPSQGSLDLTSSAGIEPDSESRRIMFQEPRLLPWARVIDNVAVGLSHGIVGEERRSRALDALERVGLSDKAEVWPATLSGGQKQRVALARALVSRPRFLALDEPLGALDALTRIDMQALIGTVWQAQGFTALLVTHDVGEAVALADRILVIEEGRVALDLKVEAPRPRHRGDAALAALEGRILDHLFRDRLGATPAKHAA